MGRRKVTALRQLATERGWLSSDSPLPDDATIAASVSPPRRASSTISAAEPFRAQIERWVAQDVGGIAIHLRSHRHGTRRTNPDHLPPESRAFFRRDRHWCLDQAQRIGPACYALIEEMLSDRIVERLRSVQGILSFADTVGTARLEAACQRALAHGSPAYRTVKSILARGLEQQPLDETLDSSSTYGQQARFLRDIRDLFSSALDPDSFTLNLTR